MSATKRILIVDDEPHIRLLLRATLEELEDSGVSIDEAADGAAALEQVESERPDLLLLDVMMPIMNGLDVCRQLRSNPNTKGIHIVLLSAKGQQTDVASGLEVGADKYFCKPFDPDEVLEYARSRLSS